MEVPLGDPPEFPLSFLPEVPQGINSEITLEIHSRISPEAPLRITPQVPLSRSSLRNISVRFCRSFFENSLGIRNEFLRKFVRRFLLNFLSKFLRGSPKTFIRSPFKGFTKSSYDSSEGFSWNPFGNFRSYRSSPKILMVVPLEVPSEVSPEIP